MNVIPLLSFRRSSVTLFRDFSTFKVLRNRPKKIHRNYEKYFAKTSKAPSVKLKSLSVWHSMNVNQLAKSLDITAEDLFEVVLEIPNTEYLNDEQQPILHDFVFTELGKKLHFKATFVSNPDSFYEEEKFEDLLPEPSDPQNLVSRSPVVAILGHVDHGKTTLLDYLRKTSVTKQEFGGITQHIGAFSVELSNFPDLKNPHLTFIDTPGHAAFKSMRNRGVLATDIAILVVDACEGVLEQTLESIRMIRESNTPFIVAINKIDKAGADIEMTKKSLRSAGIELEDFGGEVQAVSISAKNGTNVSELLHSIAVLAEILELKGDSVGSVEGIVLESEVNRGLGKTACVLIQKGTLKKGDIIVSGTHYAKVKKMMNENGVDIKTLGPSKVARVTGWKSLPKAGEVLLQCSDEKRASDVIKFREKSSLKLKALNDLCLIEKKRQMEREAYCEIRKQTLLSGRIKTRKKFVDEKHSITDSVPRVGILVKADVDGSLEAILDCLSTYENNDLVKMDIIDVGVGEVSETDVKNSDGGIIYAFNVPVNKKALTLNGDIRQCNVIYKLIEDLKSEINSVMPFSDVEEELGVATMQKEFVVTVDKKKVPVAGCKLIKGQFLKHEKLKIVRGQSVIAEDLTIDSLKHMKSEVDEISNGQECGLSVSDKSVRFQERDQLICYRLLKVRNETDWAGGF